MPRLWKKYHSFYYFTILLPHGFKEKLCYNNVPMSLFETIPGNFFSILSSKNKEIYIDALMLLHRLFHNELNIEASDFISALIELLENRAYELEDDDEITDAGLTLSVKARLILNRFIKTGWVERENMDGSFKEVVTPRPYAIRVMQLLYDLSNDRTKEYNSLVFSTYSSLKEAWDNQKSQMYEAVLNAKSNTEKLIYELKTLYHGIRGYLRRIQGQRDINILLHDHFDDYKALTDRIYHPIKTMDSVYRYITPIKEILNNVLGIPEMMNEMRTRAISIRSYENEEEAGAEIINAIDYVLDIYRTLGSIVNEIDKKHSNYTKLSVDTIRYHMSADQTISGKLVTLLKKYAASGGCEQAEILCMMEDKVRANRQEFMDGHSLWRRNIKSRRSSAKALTINVAARLSEEEADEMLKFMRNDYSLQDIKLFMDSFFSDRDSVSTGEMDIPDDREFLLLLLAAIRAGERGINFKVQVKTGSIRINGYGIPQMVFTRKRNGDKYVE
jgi:hypothetical protein